MSAACVFEVISLDDVDQVDDATGRSLHIVVEVWDGDVDSEQVGPANDVEPTSVDVLVIELREDVGDAVDKSADSCCLMSVSTRSLMLDTQCLLLLSL